MESNQCVICKHKIPGELKCKAFPNGIPESIVTGLAHDKPMFSQDNMFVYEPAKKSLE